MLGDSLLVSLEKNVYLPAGQWVDFWTGELINSTGEWRECEWPSTVGGPLFVKGGAIIPMLPAADTVMKCDSKVVMLNVYPGIMNKGEGKAFLYEDDGESFEYENRKTSFTNYSACWDNDTAEIKIDRRTGEYKEDGENRTYLIRIYQKMLPEEISWNGDALTESPDLDTLLYSKTNGWYYDIESHIVWIKPNPNWCAADKASDLNSLYGCNIDASGISGEDFGTVTLKTGKISRHYGTEINALTAKTQYSVLLHDGVSSTTVSAELTDSKGNKINNSNGKIIFTLDSVDARFEDGSKSYESKFFDGKAEVNVIAGTTEENITVNAQYEGAAGKFSDSVNISVVKGQLEIMLNPIERIRLKCENNWLPYHVYPYAAIKYNGKIIDSANSEITLKITDVDNPDAVKYIYIEKAKNGRMAFRKAIVAGQRTPVVNMDLHFSCEAVDSKTVNFFQKSNNDNVYWVSVK